MGGGAGAFHLCTDRQAQGHPKGQRSPPKPEVALGHGLDSCPHTCWCWGRYTSPCSWKAPVRPTASKTRPDLFFFFLVFWTLIWTTDTAGHYWYCKHFLALKAGCQGEPVSQTEDRYPPRSVLLFRWVHQHRNWCGWDLHCPFTSVFSSVGSTPDPQHSCCGHHLSSLQACSLECSCFILASFLGVLTCSPFCLPLATPIHADSSASMPFIPKQPTFFSFWFVFSFFFGGWGFFSPPSTTWQVTCIRGELLSFYHCMAQSQFDEAFLDLSTDSCYLHLCWK